MKVLRIGSTRGLEVGQTVSRMARRSWWQVWRDRFRQRRWGVPKTEQRQARIVAVINGSQVGVEDA
jgi:hypothetical protein